MGQHLLGPHTIGTRVVIRRVVPGERGPSGGPALTDVLGVMRSWYAGRTTIEREDGSLIEIEIADIVSGKPVPPRPSRFSRLSADEVESRTAALFVPRLVEHLGDWLLRYSGGSNRRPNSVLPVADPGCGLDDALAAVAEFYSGHGIAPCFQAVVGSSLHDMLTERGWQRFDGEEADTDVLLAGVAQLSRRLARTDISAVRHSPHLTRDWLVGNDRALANYDAVERSLRLPDAVFASILEEGHQVARGRASLSDGWALFADLTVQPGHRRRGLARVVMADLAEWAAEQGASAMLLQVQADNEPAQALYESLGFEVHHSYRYLVPPTP